MAFVSQKEIAKLFRLALLCFDRTVVLKKTGPGIFDCRATDMDKSASRHCTHRNEHEAV